MWMVLLLATGAGVSLAGAWRKVDPAARLLVWWIVLGCAELIVHDVGNERRLVFLIPPLVALAAIVVGRDRRLLSPNLAVVSRSALNWWTPIGLYLCYVLVGSIARLAFLYEVRPSVRLSAALAMIAWALLLAAWPRAVNWMSGARWAPPLSAALLAIILAGDVAQYGQWALSRTSFNYAAMREVGRLLPPGTLVHGKLANGLALENGIKPVFVGHAFGNYDDRLTRDDVRYLATYTRPSLGHEGPVILDVIDAYRWRVLTTFPVAETAGGHDMAAILEKIGPRSAPR
jgi:hypothetical protein